MKNSDDETFDAREERLAAEVIEMLDRWSDRLDGHHGQRREHSRRQFRARVAIYVPESNSMAGECAEATTVRVWARNISQGGLGFVYRGQLHADQLIVCLDPDTAGVHWVHAVVVRARQVHHDFWDYGVKFMGRAQM